MLREDVRNGAWKAAAATDEHLAALRLLQVRCSAVIQLRTSSHVNTCFTQARAPGRPLRRRKSIRLPMY